MIVKSTICGEPLTAELVLGQQSPVVIGGGVGGGLSIQNWDHMRQLLTLRAEQGELSAVERRIADYLVENAHRVRQQSSQQLANELDVSQSSVVKFAKRLGFLGYPDMKLSISEALARASARSDAVAATNDDPDTARAESLSRGKAAADEETRSLNPPAAMVEVARRMALADTLFVAGDGIDGLAVQSFAHRLAMLGRRCLPCLQPGTLRASLSAAGKRDVLLVVCERPGDPEWVRCCRDMRTAGGWAVVVSRQRCASLAAASDACLVVSAHSHEGHLADLVYESAMRQVLDDLFLRIIALDADAAQVFAANRRRCLEG
ncbi:MAG: MurR/RpiR family transcriptional regulator [Pirellulales bacterium]